MFNFFPIKFHDLDKYYLITNDAGDFFFCNKKNMNNLLFKNINNNFTPLLYFFICDCERRSYSNSTFIN